jgi:hypothetical protein
MPTLFQKGAQVLSWLWRFNTLRISKRVFSETDASRRQIVDRDFFGYRLFLDVARADTQRLLYLQGPRFIDERHLLGRLIQPGATVIDVGANIGYYMLLFAHLVGETGRIICFEPVPENLCELRRNQSRNALENVEIVEAAVGAEAGTVNFSSDLNRKSGGATCRFLCKRWTLLLRQAWIFSR